MEHGTAYAYHQGECRCDPCRFAVFNERRVYHGGPRVRYDEWLLLRSSTPADPIPLYDSRVKDPVLNPRQLRQPETVKIPKFNTRPFDPMDWREAARCVGKTDLFFGSFSERPERKARREARARAVCRACPAIVECRAWAREHREHGLWGGETEEERAAAGFAPMMPVGNAARAAKRYQREAATG